MVIDSQLSLACSPTVNMYQAIITNSQGNPNTPKSKTTQSLGKNLSYVALTRLGFQREDERGFDNENENDEEDMDNWELEEEENQYDHNLDINARAHMSHEDRKSSLAHLPKVPKHTKPGMCAKKLVVDKNVIGSWLLELQERGVILYTIDFNPSTNAFEIWAYTKSGGNLCIKIE